MKVLSKRDTSGIKKIKLIDNLSVSASYNFLADSMKLSTIPSSSARRSSAQTSASSSTPRSTRTGSPPEDGASTNSSFRGVSFRRAGRSVIPSNRGRITPRRDQRHQQRPARIRQPLLRPLRHPRSCAAKAVHGAVVLRLLAAVEPRLQLHGLLLDQLRQQRYDGLPQEHHAEHRVQRQRQPHAQDGHHVPGRFTTSRRTS